ncbi:MAG: nucleoside hydrolase [Candidatus Acidiferrales bacterium]
MKIESKRFVQTRREFLTTSAGLALATTAAGMPANGAERRNLRLNAPLRVDAAKPRRIIIDTDPGVDDAMAIFLALRSPELKVEAITPVSGNVPLELTLPNALRLVEIAGREDVPVAPGASLPLVRRLVTAKYAHGKNGLGGVDFPAPRLKPAAETATEMIRRLVRGNPGEITIVAIGPLTNIATVLRSDPEIAGMIPAIVIMGGSLSRGNITPAAEFNLYVDPEAARIVFDAGVPLTMVGLDVTEKVLLTEAHAQKLEAAKNPVSQAAAKIMRATIDRMRQENFGAAVAMHDPLTVASLLDPNLLTFTEYAVEIETEGEFTAGMTVGYTHPPVRGSAPMALAGPEQEEPGLPFHPNARVATGVEPDRFFDLLIPRLTQAG